MKKKWEKTLLQSQELKVAKKKKKNLSTLWLETMERQFWAFSNETKVSLVRIGDRQC